MSIELNWMRGMKNHAKTLGNRDCQSGCNQAAQVKMLSVHACIAGWREHRHRGCEAASTIDGNS